VRPEHVLLGLIAANSGLAVTVLSTFGVEPAALIHAVDQVLPTAGGPVLAGRDRGYPQIDGPIDDWLPMPPSESLRRLMINAAGAADMAERSEIEVLDLLAAVTHFTNVTLLSRLGVDDERLRRAVERRWNEERKLRRLGRRPLTSHATSQRGDDGRRVTCGQQVRDPLTAASARAMERGGAKLEVSDVLLALTLDQETAATLSDLGVDPAVSGAHSSAARCLTSVAALGARCKLANPPRLTDATSLIKITAGVGYLVRVRRVARRR
jgi:hypothetical protein